MAPSKPVYVVSNCYGSQSDLPTGERRVLLSNNSIVEIDVYGNDKYGRWHIRSDGTAERRT